MTDTALKSPTSESVVADAPRSSPPAGVQVPRVLGVREMARLLRPVRGRVLACASLSAGGAAAGLGAFVAIAELARTVVGAGDLDAVRGRVWMWALLAVGGLAGRLVLLGLSSNLGHHADAMLLRHLRVRMVAHVGAVPLGWVRSVGSGHIKRAMTDELEQLHLLIAHALGQLVAGATVIVLGVAYLALVDVPMALVTVSVPALTVVAYCVAMRSMPGHVDRLVTADGRIAAASVEYADGITVVKTFGAGGRLLDRFSMAVNEYVAAFRVWVRQTRFSSALSMVLASEMSLLIVVVSAGSGFVRAGRLEFVDVVAFTLVGVALPVALMPAISAAQGLRQARMSAGAVDALLCVPALPVATRSAVPVDGRVEFERVSFSYDGAIDVLAEVSAVCEPGTVTALVGPSGAGKSTLASLLPRFYDVTAGAIRVGGIDVREMTPQALLSSLALVFQDAIVLHDTAAANIRIGRPTATDAEVRTAAAAANIGHVIEQLPHGYDTVLGSDGGGLSGGERQRLTIARAILADAPIVVLDEATAALDPDSEAAVQDAMASLAAGKTVIVIAHRLHTIAGADQILVLDAGRLVERGTHTELLARGGLYARLWSAQSGGAR